MAGYERDLALKGFGDRRPAPVEAVDAEPVARTMTGETVFGVPVLAWMWEQRTEAGPVPVTAYHWSTPPKDAAVVRLVDAATLASFQAENERLRKERDSLQAALTARAKTLLRLRDALCTVHDHIEDEGDRVYFGSTNHADELKQVWHELDGWSWDGILADGKLPDIYAACRKANARATAAESLVSDLRKEVERKDGEVKAILKSVLFHFGPEGANKVTKDALDARAALNAPTGEKTDD